jgi:fumarylacetoacetase
MNDFTHDAQALSWVDAANDLHSDFPLQNLPWARFRTAPSAAWRVGVAIGDQVLDVQAAGVLGTESLAQVMALPAARRRVLRHMLWRGLAHGSAEQGPWAKALIAQTEVELGLPCEVGDYTDFYTGIHHARAVGKLLRPDNPLLPNYQWLPVGYHGRASSIVPSGTAVQRPWGQTMAAGDSTPQLGPTQRLDYELELAAWVGPGNALGTPVPMQHALDHIAGITLLNDWSARDVQSWEYQPLGPFLSKNFATTVSPWLVTLDALEPFRAPHVRPPNDPAPLAYLDSADNRAQGAWDIKLEVWIQTQAMQRAGSAGHCVSRSNWRDAYWSLAQLVAHHTVNGCNLRTGDVLGTGTLSGPHEGQGGCLMELSQGGKQPVPIGPNAQRTFLQDGDTVTLKAYAQRDGARRIGFGSCSGTVLAARTA